MNRDRDGLSLTGTGNATGDRYSATLLSGLKSTFFFLYRVIARSLSPLPWHDRALTIPSCTYTVAFSPPKLWNKQAIIKKLILKKSYRSYLRSSEKIVTLGFFLSSHLNSAIVIRPVPEHVDRMGYRYESSRSSFNSSLFDASISYPSCPSSPTSSISSS